MTKTDLINAVAAKTGLSKKDSDKAVAAFVEAVTESLAKGEKVALLGFGTFDVKKKAGGTKINPFTGKKMVVKACKVPTFKMSATLKTLLK